MLRVSDFSLLDVRPDSVASQVSTAIAHETPRVVFQPTPGLAEGLHASATAGAVSSSPRPLKEIAVEYVKQPAGFRRMVILPGIKVYKWSEFILGCFQGFPKTCGWGLKRFSHLFKYIVDLPSHASTLSKSTRAFHRHLVERDFRQASLSAADMYISSSLGAGVVAETLKVGFEEGFYSLAPAQIYALSVISFLGNVALVISSVRAMKNLVSDLRMAESKSPVYNHTLIELAKKVCVLGLAVIGMASFTLGATVSSFAMLSLTTILLVLSLTSYFYQKRHRLDENNSVAK